MLTSVSYLSRIYQWSVLISSGTVFYLEQRLLPFGNVDSFLDFWFKTKPKTKNKSFPGNIYIYIKILYIHSGDSEILWDKLMFNSNLKITSKKMKINRKYSKTFSLTVSRNVASSQRKNKKRRKRKIYKDLKMHGNLLQ